MGGVSGDNIEGLSNFAAFLAVTTATTTTIVAARVDFAPVVESVVIGATVTAGQGAIHVQTFDGSAVTDQIELRVSATHANLGATRIKMKAKKGDLVRVISAGTNITATVHVDGRWIGGDGPNFS